MPIEKSCYWMDHSPSDPQPALQGRHRSDITIIGAGYTGLWTALFLKELSPGAEVAIVEQRVAGYGGSGRNGGILGETIDHSHGLAIKHFGFEEAQKLAEIGHRNVNQLVKYLSVNGIDCDFERTGRLFVALNNAQWEEAQSSMEVASRLGITGMRLLNAEEAQSEIHSPLYLGAVFASGGGILHPMKLVNGLKAAALKQGTNIFEQSPVRKWTGNSVEANQGNIQTEKVILATDAYTHHLFPKLLRYFIPLYDYILVSEPLNDQQMNAIGWRNRQGVTDGRTFFNYYRLTADNRILWGTSEAKYYSPNRVDPSCDDSEEHYSALRKSFAWHFPQLASLQFSYQWGGPIASTTRLTPFFGSLENGHVHYALGYTGHGIGSTRIAGKILAKMALGEDDDLLQLAIVQKKPFPYPPEPLRNLAVNAVTSGLRKVDEGRKPGFLLRILDRVGLGFSS